LVDFTLCLNIAAALNFAYELGIFIQDGMGHPNRFANIFSIMALPLGMRQ